MYGHHAAVKEIAEISGHDWTRERARSPQAIQKIKASIGREGNIFDRQFTEFFNEKLFTAQELAAIYGHVEAALSFPSSSKDDLRHALSCACMVGNAHMVEEIWNHHKNRWYFQRHRSLESRVPSFPAPPLHLAVMSGSRPTVAFFLDRGWNANGTSRQTFWEAFWGDTPSPSLLYSSPAHYAATTELLKDLRRRGADADLTALGHRSRTPLSYAVENQNEFAVKLLVDQKYPRRGWNSISHTYLGSGHVWHDKKRKAAAIPSKEIKKALKSVGFSV